MHDLHFFTTSLNRSIRIVLFPAEEHAPYEPASEASDLTSQRLIALRSMLQAHVQIIVTTPQAIVPYVMPRVQLQQAGLDLVSGMTLDRQECIERLVRCGYHQVDLVEEWGDFGVRGGIIDLFPPHLPRPIRLEFMGDEIESLREFDLATQRSLRTVEQATVVPLRANHRRSTRPGTRSRPGLSRHDLDLTRLREIVACLEQYIFPPGVERLLPVFCDTLEPLFDYLPPDAVLVLDEPAVIDAKLEEFTTAVGKAISKPFCGRILSLPPRRGTGHPPSSLNASRHANASCYKRWQATCVRVRRPNSSPVTHWDRTTAAGTRSSN